jgi:hypothetical protein
MSQTKIQVLIAGTRAYGQNVSLEKYVFDVNIHIAEIVRQKYVEEFARSSRAKMVIPQNKHWTYANRDFIVDLDDLHFS